MRKKWIQRQQELLNTAKAAGRELTADEQTEFDDLQRKIDEFDQKEAERQAQATAAAQAQPEQAEDLNAVREAERSAERSRIREIEAICTHFGVNAREYIDNGTSVDATRKAVMEKLMQDGTPIRQTGSAEVTKDGEDKFRDAVSDSLLMRAGIELAHPADGARELQGLSLRDIFIECEERANGTRGLNRKTSDDLFTMAQRQFFNPTAAFPAILDNAINKAYVEGHKTVAVTFDRITKKGSLKDFKTADNNYLAGPVGEFLEVPEGSELKHDVWSDEKLPTRKLKTYGRQFTLTRQAFINDDIDVVTRIPAKYAASARKTINKQVYSILVNNPAIYDGVALFHSNHKNVLATGTGVTQAAMQAMIMALQTQEDQFGEAIIVRPAKLVVPVGLAFDFYTLFHSPTINGSGNTQAVNPLYRYANQIEIIEEPTINVLCGGFGNTMPWFLLGASEDTDFIEVDYLNGQEIPTIRRMEVAGQLGFVWDIYLDWGISVMDFRGAIKNPGVQIDSPLS
ncbi:MAG: hypothetical protein IJL07_10450 [Lachnospiraceae bacterium]|nr:hypothetical protein [Lachnospiraceae bacterium]